ncbi:TELO2-interacting protein 1 homolog isoform X1 [Dysidea avara]|uniref:TELO2-interacting protein 1 homolog isoform X1 n=1 Tax=Dysidea avara TaxID=196820 RepID=UPI0033218018
MDRDAENSKTFQKLKPLCVAVLRSPSKQSVGVLNSAVNDLTAIDPKLLEYVLFPLRMVLKRPNVLDSEPAGMVERILTCVTCVVAKSTITSREQFDEFLRLSCIVLDEKLIHQLGRLSYSEDIVHVGLNLLLVILHNASDELMTCLLSRGAQLPVVGHCVSVLLTVIQSHSSRDVQLTTLDCLTALSGVRQSLLPPDGDNDGMVWVKHIGYGFAGSGTVFSSFLPGIALSLCKLVTENPKAGQKVISSGLLAWTHFVSLVMNDNERNMATTSDTDDVKESEMAVKQLEVKRNPKWWQETSEKLDILISRITHLTSHPSWLVRWSLCVCSYCLLTCCSNVLALSVSKCIEVLVSLQGDSISGVSSASSMLLEAFSDEFAIKSSRSLISISEESIYTLCTNLSKSLLSQNDDQKLCTLNLLVGYVKLLGPHISRLGYSVSHLNALFLSLVQCLKLELSDIRIMEEQVNEVSDELLAWTLPLHFVNFRDNRIFHCIEQVCACIGCHIQLEPVIDQLMDMFHSSELHRKEAILVLKNVIFGTVGLLSPVSHYRHESVLQHVKEIVTDFVSPVYWHCSTSNINDSAVDHNENTLSFKQLNSNVLLVCLMLQSVGTFVQVVGGSFEPLLQVAIYPLMEKLGDRNVMISNTAHHTVSLIAHHCGYASMSTLITANADYLVNAVSLNLRRISIHPEAPTVLRAVLLYGAAEVLPLIQDSIDEVMFALDIHQEKEHSIWPVLLALVTAIVKWYPNNLPPINKVKKTSNISGIVDEDRNHKISKDKMREFFLNYHRQKQQEDEEDTEVPENHDQDSTENDETKPHKKPKLPIHHQAALDVLKRCAYFVATDVLRTKLIVLAAIALSLRALQDVQDELLPQVNKIWPAFTRRFVESNPLVVLKAIEVLVAMADVCRDFLRRRVSKEVWPLLMSKLEQLAVTSRTAGESYRHTASCKLQKTILNNLAMLAEKLEISSENYERLAYACIPYLNHLQPTELQVKAKKCLSTLSVNHADMVWLLLQQVKPLQVVQPPHPTLKPYSFPAHQTAVQYHENIQSLLELTLCRR